MDFRAAIQGTNKDRRRQLAEEATEAAIEQGSFSLTGILGLPEEIRVYALNYLHGTPAEGGQVRPQRYEVEIEVTKPIVKHNVVRRMASNGKERTVPGKDYALAPGKYKMDTRQATWLLWNHGETERTQDWDDKRKFLQVRCREVLGQSQVSEPLTPRNRQVRRPAGE